MDWERLNRELEIVNANSIVVRRVNIASINSHLLAFESEEKFYPTNQLKLIDSKQKSIHPIIFNSIISFSQFYANKEDTQGIWIDIHGQDVACLYLPKIDSLTETQKSDIKQLWDELKDKKFPPLLTQLKELSAVRLKLDHELFEIFGINYDIKKLYRAVAEEIERNVGIK